MFNRLKNHLDLSDWSKDIRVTFSTGVRNDKLCASKLDHVLAKNIESDAFIECTVDSSLVTKGGHYAIVGAAAFPQLVLVEPDPVNDPPDRPIYLDYSKVSIEQERALRGEMEDIIKPYMDNIIQTRDNPIQIINRVFTTIGSRATFILNQKRYSQRNKKVPGWTKYGMAEIQRRIHLVEEEWSCLLYTSPSPRDRG